jgi:hypothetical protein
MFKKLSIRKTLLRNKRLHLSTAYLSLSNFAELREMLLQILVRNISGNSADKDLAKIKEIKGM